MRRACERHTPDRGRMVAFPRVGGPYRHDERLASQQGLSGGAVHQGAMDLRTRGNRMTQFAAVNLQILNYTQASDGTGNSKPYIWPAVVWIDSKGVSVTSPAVGLARVMIANGMHAGDTAAIPPSVGQQNAQIGDSFQGLVLVVALWDQRDTPDNVVQSGFQAFSSELRAAIQDSLIA